jgi:Predicted ATPase (AAA+ superfamily)
MFAHISHAIQILYMEIVGRKAEKLRLDKMMASGQSEFLALYGRRRVGKTYLIRQYLKAHIVFDISGTKDGNKREQLANFFEEYLTRSKAQLETRAPDSWGEMFRYLAHYLAQLPPTPAKHVVFLDEMPWMDTPKSDFVSALEFFLEPTWLSDGQPAPHRLRFGLLVDTQAFSQRKGRAVQPGHAADEAQALQFG